MKNLFAHIRTYILRGLLAIVPLLLCVAAIRLLYVLIDKKIIVFLSQFVEVRQIPGLGILLLLICLYLIGLILSNILGKQFLRFIENISKKIPFIGSIYSVGKQLTQGFGVDNKTHAFKKAVLIKLNENDIWVPGFSMGTIQDRTTNEELVYVYIPTVPTPTGGFVFIVKSSQVIDPGWSVEEGLKVIVSMGIISPKKM